MTRKNAEAHLSVIMALRTKLRAHGIVLQDLDPSVFPRFVIRYVPSNQAHGLQHTGTKCIIMEAEIPLRGDILVSRVSFPDGSLPIHLLFEFEALLSASWQSIGGHLRSLA